MVDQTQTPQNRTDGAEPPETGPKRTPQGRTEEEPDRADDDRPGGA